jgi:hypothetical protein
MTLSMSGVARRISSVIEVSFIIGLAVFSGGRLLWPALPRPAADVLIPA